MSNRSLLRSNTELRHVDARKRWKQNVEKYVKMMNLS